MDPIFSKILLIIGFSFMIFSFTDCFGIIGGVPASASYPFFAVIRKRSSFCGGTFIAPNAGIGFFLLKKFILSTLLDRNHARSWKSHPSSWKQLEQKNRTIKKHRRDGMSRLGTSRNVQWSAEGARKCVYPRFQNLVNLSSLRSRKFR